MTIWVMRSSGEQPRQRRRRPSWSRRGPARVAPADASRSKVASRPHERGVWLGALFSARAWLDYVLLRGSRQPCGDHVQDSRQARDARRSTATPSASSLIRPPAAVPVSRSVPLRPPRSTTASRSPWLRRNRYELSLVVRQVLDVLRRMESDGVTPASAARRRTERRVA